jgi:hypothetical protein
MDNQQQPQPRHSPLRDDADAILPAAAYLRYETRADGWGPGRQAAFLAHLADNGVVAEAARSVGMSLGGGYSLRRTARGYAFNLGWEAALIIARRIVADNLMSAAIRGEQSQWVREEGVTTYTRQNSKLALTLLDRVNPAIALPEVLAVATRFDWFLQLIEEGVSAADLWEMFFNDALPHSEHQARARVRAALLLSEDSADFNKEDSEDGEEDDTPIEYKSMDGPPRRNGGILGSREGAKARRDRVSGEVGTRLQVTDKAGYFGNEWRFAKSKPLGALAPLREPESRTTIETAFPFRDHAKARQI